MLPSNPLSAGFSSPARYHAISDDAHVTRLDANVVHETTEAPVDVRCNVQYEKPVAWDLVHAISAADGRREDAL
jgi:hypothetical protein